MAAIAWVGVGHSAQAELAEQDDEGRFCTRWLARQLAGCGARLALPAADWPTMAAQARLALAPALPDSALVLLLRQPPAAVGTGQPGTIGCGARDRGRQRLRLRCAPPAKPRFATRLPDAARP